MYDLYKVINLYVTILHIFIISGIVYSSGISQKQCFLTTGKVQ